MTNALWRHSERWARVRYSVRVCSSGSCLLFEPTSHRFPYVFTLCSCQLEWRAYLAIASLLVWAHIFLHPGVPFSSPLPTTHPSEVDPSFLIPTLSLARRSIAEIFIFQLVVTCLSFPLAWELLEKRHVSYLFFAPLCLYQCLDRTSERWTRCLPGGKT